LNLKAPVQYGLLMGAAGGPVKVERDGGEYPPGAVGGEVPGRQVRQRSGFEVGVDLLEGSGQRDRGAR
jgi:hypothetical protein